MRKLLPFLLFCITLPAFSQSIAGRWRTIDDVTGKAKSIVEITVKDGKASGRIVELVDPAKKDALCTACTDDRKGQRILGMEIIRNLKADDDEWTDGTILDPENGKVYDCKLWVEDGALKMRGYIGFLYRTQTWVR